jgi:septum formation protein
MSARIILASASPRRKALLEQINIQAVIRPVDLDETPIAGETPLAYVQRIALEKAIKCASVSQEKLPVLAADTAVVLADEIFGKPLNQAEGVRMLNRLSGRTHKVYSAVCLLGKAQRVAVSITEVTFRPITEQEIYCYWQTGEPADKAGGYAIQGMAAAFIETITGSYSGVMGLPLFETADLLAKEGINLLHE